MRNYKEPTVEDRIESAREDAFQPVAGMNRQERRTVKGRMMVALAEANALREENKILHEEIQSKL